MVFKVKKITLIIFSILFFIFPSFSFASPKCLNDGYTISAINGIFTNKKEAEDNQKWLNYYVGDTYNGEKIDYQYLLNPSHIAGLGDLAMSAYQKIFDYEAVKDYDLVEMLKDASEKVKTQKLLLVAHSQGNFYANSFYDSVAGKDGGVPQESIGVYAVATPAGRVAGGGKWLTSDTDKVIVDLVGLFPFKKIMVPNTSIVLTKGDDFKGHNFSGMYLKYRGKEIISGIRETLGRLAENNVQSKESPCLAPPKLTMAHKIQGEILSAVDPFANMAIDGIVIAAVEAYQTGKALAKGASSLSGLIAGAYDSVLPEDNKNTNNETVFFDVIKPENFSSLSAEETPMSRSRLDIAGEALNVLQNQILSLKNQASFSSESIAISRLNLDIAQDQPKFIAAIYPGFGGGGDGGAASVSSLSASSADSSSSAGSSSSASLPAEEAGESSSSVFSESSSSSSSSAPAPDTTPPELSLVISECQNSLSSDGCLVATTTLNIAWSSPSSDLDYFVINNNGFVSATTATSTIAIVSDNAVFSFSVSAKDLTGNFSATSTQTAEIFTMPVVINEVAWAGNGAAYSADEWIELYNRTNKSVNLSNWILYSATDLSPYVVLTGAISARGYYLLERTNDNTVSDIAADKIYTGALNNSGENLILSYASSTIDEIPYDSNWYAGSDFNYSSMERYDAFAAGTSSSNWLANNTVIINGKNAGNGNINGTPKARNSANYLINRGQNIYSNLTLSASGSPYLVNNTLQTFSASSTLTIEPGVVIKFYNDAGFQFISGAKILAQGSAADPIIFTSFYDDTYGGDTNGDNSVRLPTPGNWFGVRIDSPGTESTISNSVFRYGGKYYSGGGWTDSKANLYVANSSAVVSDSVFEYGKVYGVRLSAASTTFSGSAFRYNNNSEEGDSTGLYSSVGTLTLNSNIFSNNKRGLYISGADSASISSNTFTSNTGEAIYSYGRLGSYSGNSGTGNGVNAISINGTITQNGATTTLSANSLPYLLQGIVTVAASSTLAINPGITIKGWNNSATSYLNIYGNLIISGANFSDIIFGSMYDSPAKGNWGGLRFYSGSQSAISGATFEYADSASRTYPITASNVTFTNNTATTSPGGLW